MTVSEGGYYWRSYGVDVRPRTLEWITDENGFRNSQSRASSDIVIIGDSFIEYGDNEEDTFGKRLEQSLNGLTVINLGKAGYNPFQYLEVFKRYGLAQKPQFALFCFYEGNDISEMKMYLRWKRGEGSYYGSSQTFMQKYWAALFQTTRLLTGGLWQALEAGLRQIYPQSYHPDIVVVRLSVNRQYRTLFVDRLKVRSTGDMLQSEEWSELRKILNAFKNISAKNGIVPLIMYIPSVAHIYADYSTGESGGNWLAARDAQIAVKNNEENAMGAVAQELKIELVNLVALFEEAARQGKMVYETLDSHWNAEGREIAARYVADLLKSKYGRSTRPN
jgi:hypothetical protein